MRGTPWDIYVDERTDRHRALGFLAVPNSASFMHKLFKARHVRNEKGETTIRNREIHWNEPRGDTIPVVQAWLKRVFQHHRVKFYLKHWPREETKEKVILDFLADFCRWRGLQKPYNIVVFLDFHSSHAKKYIQNTIRETGQILRCYHLDSRNNDCLQCCDLLLNAMLHLRDDPTARWRHDRLLAKFNAGEKLADQQIKQLHAGELAQLIDSAPRNVYTL